jgi:UDP-2-acetamido-3-amino-2,3-dideoxy-glucuronate N-acetyltransferase
VADQRADSVGCDWCGADPGGNQWNAEQYGHGSGAMTPKGKMENKNYFVHESSYVDDPCSIGPGTKIWHFSHVMKNSTIGAGCNIGQNVVISPDVTIGNNVKIQNNVSVYTGCVLEDDVFCGPSMVFTNVLLPRAHVSRRAEFLPTLVRRGASIGANATIVCGHTIGAYAMIGAGAVVTRDVPDFALMIGAPARRIGWVSRSGERLKSDLVCPRTGERYRLEKGQLALSE